MISFEKPICAAVSECGGFKIAYFAMQGIGEIQPVLCDDRGRQFYVTHATDSVVYREIPVGKTYMASGTEPIVNLPNIVQAMPRRLLHFKIFIERQRQQH